MAKREKFKEHVKTILGEFTFRSKIAGILVKDQRTVKSWIEADNPDLMTEEVVAFAMKTMGALDRSDVTEWVDEKETADAQQG